MVPLWFFQQTLGHFSLPRVGGDSLYQKDIDFFKLDDKAGRLLSCSSFDCRISSVLPLSIMGDATGSLLLLSLLALVFFNFDCGHVSTSYPIQQY